MSYEWRERMEKYIGGIDSGVCCGIHCSGCVFVCPDRKCVLNYAEFGLVDIKARIFLFRHLLTTIQNFDDNEEIRERIAEMLDDPEKFLGKAKEDEPRYKFCEPATGYYGSAEGGKIIQGNDRWPPKFPYTIVDTKGGHIAAFLSEDTARKVLKFLNDLEKRKR